MCPPRRLTPVSDYFYPCGCWMNTVFIFTSLWILLFNLTPLFYSVMANGLVGWFSTDGFIFNKVILRGVFYYSRQ